MVIDKNGYRLNVGIVLIGPERNVFIARRIGQDAWQFPQGGVMRHESLKQALYRELKEEIGLDKEDVHILTISKEWHSYRLPRHLIHYHRKPVCIGQKQKWFLLQLIGSEQKIRFDLSSTPEFDSWRWVDFWYPLQQVIEFKYTVYQEVLSEFEPYVLGTSHPINEKID